MITIRITKMVNAPMDRCFRLARSIDLQCAARGPAVASIEGSTSGLIGAGDSISWQHRPSLKTMVDVFRPPSYYREVMVEGDYMSYEHEHHFAPFNDGTRIREEIRVTPSNGLFGRIAMWLYLRKRLTRQVEQHIAMLKRVAESEEWHVYLDGKPDFDVCPQPVPQSISKTAALTGQSSLAEQHRRQQTG